MAYRGFIAVGVGGLSKILDFGEALKKARGEMKLVEADNIHMTVKFLGKVDDRKNERILECMKAAVEGMAPFEMSLKGVGAFPADSNPRVIWIAAEGAEPIGEMAKRLNSSMKRLGFPPEEREFAPHITVARVRGDRNRERVMEVVNSYSGAEFGTVKVDCLHLKRSFLTNEGPVYTTVSVAKLAG
ncbi:MAG: RNA 2',3'-cyclic phosphodiesterase [Euryarchaeota archaeon]|nr:RNA 2',3'-cyclic phosphodiesterase [Euryarchaeota archaeon]